MPDILDEVAELINSWRSCPAPIKAMRALQRRAPPEKRGYFLLLWSDLVLEMKEHEGAASVGSEQMRPPANQHLGIPHENPEARGGQFREETQSGGHGSSSTARVSTWVSEREACRRHDAISEREHPQKCVAGSLHRTMKQFVNRAFCDADVVLNAISKIESR